MTNLSFTYNRPGPGCGLIIDSIVFECCTPSPCGSYPNLNLGNDVTICNGQSVNFNVPSGYDYFSWNIVSGNPTTVTVNSTQTVILNVQNLTTTNLVTNGDFESGSSGFSSGYNFPSTPPPGNCCGLLSNEGDAAITTDPHSVHNNFGTCADVTTTGPGNMLVVNGSTVPNTQVWGQLVSVDPNTVYNFSAWVTAVETTSNSSNMSSLQFYVNGVQIGPIFQTTLNGCDWHQFFQTWNSGSATTADLSIIAQTTVGNNDFALDNIAFIPTCLQSDTVHVTLDPSTIDAGPNVAFCQNEPETITASTNYPNPAYTWETGEHTATITPTTSGYYTVSATSPNGCLISDSALVNITMMPWDFQETDSVPTDCGINNGAVFTVMTPSSTFNDPPYYTWNGPGANNPNFIHASVWQNLPSGWYYISVESDGCYRYDSVFVSINNPPVANLSGTPLTGDAPLDVTFTNSSTSATDYVWNFGNGTTTTATDNSGQNQTYTDPGTYTAYLVANQGNCHDTAFVTIVVNTPPVPPIPPVIVPVDLSYPNVFTPNGDGINDYFEFQLLNIKTIHVDVLNRWGEVVYSTDDVNFKWDGKVGGKMASEGVYTFKYEAKGAQDESLKGQGFVHLIEQK